MLPHAPSRHCLIHDPDQLILYRDDALLALNKPAGLLVHRGWGDDEVTALSVARHHAGAWVYPVHRLDRGTSGVLLFALSSEVAAATQRSFESGLARKRYLAIVRGVAPTQAHVDHPLAKEKGLPKLPAVTTVTRLERRWGNSLGEPFDRYSLVEALPQTGRLHQIRRHLKHLGHPIIGDVRFGKAEHNRKFRDIGFVRMALHAESLNIPHPVTGAPLEVRAPLDASFSGLIVRLGYLPPEAGDGRGAAHDPLCGASVQC